MNLTSAAVAANVRAEVARVGASQNTLAQALGLSQAAVSKRLRGATPWRIDELGTVADLLGVSVHVLIAPLPTAPTAVAS